MPAESQKNGSPDHWLRYAQADLDLARVPLPKRGMYEQLCFLAQQAAEKSIKAILVSAGVEFPRTHDLQALVDLLPAVIRRPPAVGVVARLTAYAVSSRYPGEEEPVTEEEYREAVQLAEAVVAWAEAWVCADAENQ
jgi:HEPN domain-containing protein